MCFISQVHYYKVNSVSHFIGVIVNQLLMSIGGDKLFDVLEGYVGWAGNI